MFRVMLAAYDQPVICWTADDEPEHMRTLGYLDTSRFYDAIPAGWLLAVEGAANGACNNL